jgi:hypothetical protein
MPCKSACVSPEAKMAIESKRIQLQLATDTQFDQVAKYEYETFRDINNSIRDINENLLLLSIAIIFMGIVCYTR